jgi:hypothetical protein
MHSHEMTLRTDQFMFLFSGRGDKLSTDATVTFAGEFTIYRVNHADFGSCVGVVGITDFPLVFSERKIPALYPRHGRSDQPVRAA